MTKLGIVTNVSHASDATIEQVVELSSEWVVATHHGLRSSNDIPRVMPDHVPCNLTRMEGLMRQGLMRQGYDVTAAPRAGSTVTSEPIVPTRPALGRARPGSGPRHPA